jgi:hypothetical protein
MDVIKIQENALEDVNLDSMEILAIINVLKDAI